MNLPALKVRFKTIGQTLLQAMNKGIITLYSLNYQSLRAHAADLRDNIIKSSILLLLSETWLDKTKNSTFVIIIALLSSRGQVQEWEV